MQNRVCEDQVNEEQETEAEPVEHEAKAELVEPNTARAEQETNTMEQTEQKTTRAVNMTGRTGSS